MHHFLELKYTKCIGSRGPPWAHWGRVQRSSRPPSWFHGKERGEGKGGGGGVSEWVTDKD